MFPGGLTAFESITVGHGSLTVDSINSGTGLRLFTVVSSSNAVVNIPEFASGTFDPVTATFTAIDPNLPMDITFRATNQYHGVLIRLQDVEDHQTESTSLLPDISFWLPNSTTGARPMPRLALFKVKAGTS